MSSPHRPSPGEAVVQRVSALARAMRERGARVGVEEVLAAHRALAAVNAARPAEARIALRATLCSRRDDLAAFDAAFAAMTGGKAEPRRAAPELDPVARVILPRSAAPGRTPSHGELDHPEPRPAMWSEIELLREADFAELSDRERAAVLRLMPRLMRAAPTRRSRRLRAAQRQGGARPDLRRTLRASLRTGGEPVERRWRAPTVRPRPLALVCDVSGSMDPYARMMLGFLHAAVATRQRVEAFVFGTRLSRVTRELRASDPASAVERAVAAAEDFAGGTRIGAALGALNREHGRRLGRGAVVVILSDGWDRGEPDLLGEEMARLRRCAHRVVWLNPLKSRPGYEPLVRGMQEALPHTDHFMAASSLASLEELVTLLETGLGVRAQKRSEAKAIEHPVRL